MLVVSVRLRLHFRLRVRLRVLLRVRLRVFNSNSVVLVVNVSGCISKKASNSHSYVICRAKTKDLSLRKVF